MIGTRNHLALLGLGGFALFGTSACNLSFDIETTGSGISETVTYDFDSFDEIDISSAFEAEITIAEGSPTVEVTIDDNLVDELEVKVDDGELNVGLDHGNITFGSAPKVIVSVSSLRELELSGAASAIVMNLDEEQFKVDVSGAGDAELNGDITELQIQGSGAASISVDGTVDTVDMDLSGASSADLSSTVTKAVKLDLSGASSASFGDVDDVTGDLSGGASITVPQSTSVSVDSSGGSDINRS